MDYGELLKKRDYLNENIHLIPQMGLQNYEDSFAAELKRLDWTGILRLPRM